MTSVPPPPYEEASKAPGNLPQHGTYGYDQPPPQAPPQQAYPPQAPPQQGYVQHSSTTVVNTGAPVVVGGGNCPACGVGILTEGYSILGIIIAVLFFPLGVICCLLMTEKRCSRCGATY